MLHTLALAERIKGQLECRVGTRFNIVGSIATNGQSTNDIDLRFAGSIECDSELFELVMTDMGFEMLGNTSYGEVWKRFDGVVLDIFWEKEA